MLAVVGARVELRRTGVNSYFGNCPFHDERTGSFHVRPDEKHYHCFGCGESGTAIDFVMQTEGLDFKGALESLASRFGLELQTENEDPAAAERRQRRERLYSLMRRAAAYYARYLWEAGEAAAAREYLLGRGLTEETLREFRVGFSPKTWDKLLLASRSAGYSDEELVAVGLAQRSHARPGQVYDRFRERIMFPSVDVRGRVVGFGARAMRDNQQPKYLNTSDGELYHKREQLFGIDLARVAATKAGSAILVEGYTDVLALHQAGLRNAVGIMGTSLTDQQLDVLQKIANVLDLCLDADDAGQEAMLKAAKGADGRRLDLRVVSMPSGSDPAELIAREGADALRKLVADSRPFVAFNISRILEKADTRSAEGRDRALAEIGPLMADVPPSVVREELVRQVAGTLELTEARLAALLSEPGPRRGGAAGAGQVSAAPTPNGNAGLMDVAQRPERTFLALCIAFPRQGREALAAIDPDEHLSSELARRAARHLATRTDMPLTGIDPTDDELARTIADLVKRAGRPSEVGPDNLEHTRLVLELGRIERAMRRARAGRSGDVTTLARERESVKEAIRMVVSKLEDAG